jgi:hypothetical protein
MNTTHHDHLGGVDNADDSPTMGERVNAASDLST